ncbi:hypothetical protein BKA64DRAFT_707253 [Cadophora sp. MPI-SDFR-AT-0126]|nr:hypothetical protein BKA64DRAFT_707253 [Leotiomycetes sp. MPI-SDFR-AT-0126]
MKAAAIEPTSAGQIGVNLVDPIPSAPALVGKIGKNTEYLTDLGGSTTSWRGPDQSFITKTTVTVTNTAGALATITKQASVTVTQDADGNFSILLGPALRAKLVDIAKTIPACGAKKRAVACGYQAFADAVAQYGPIAEVAEIENAMPAGRFVIPANDIAQLVALFKAGAATAASPAVIAGGGTLGLLYIVYEQWNHNQNIAPALDVPNSIAGTMTESSTTSTTTACPSSTAQPSCPDDDCQGDENHKCTVGDKKGCQCGDPYVDIPTNVATEWINLRSIVEQITLSVDKMPVPVCTGNNKVAMDTKLWKAIVKNVCPSQSLSEDISAIQTSKDVGFTGYEGWTFALSWRYEQGDCVFGCEEMFIGFLSSTQCSYDSNLFSTSGINHQDCGTASFAVNQPLEPPQPSPTPNAPTSAGPAQGVPNCGEGLFFQRSDAANSAKTFCTQLSKDGSWSKGAQSLKFSKVQIYNQDGTLHPGQELALSMDSDVSWCPSGLTLKDLGTTLTVDRCVANFMTGVDGCAPFVAAESGPFLKTVGLSYEDCIQWQISVVEA